MRSFFKARAVSWCVFIASVLGAPIASRAAERPKASPGPVAVASTSVAPVGVQTTAQKPVQNTPQMYGDLPLSFEANHGQANPRVRFLSRGSGYTFFLTPAEAVLAFSKGNKDNQAPSDSRDAILHMRLEGSNSTARISGRDSLPGTSNYFVGNDPNQWRTGVPTYRKVAYENIYPGINLVYYGSQRQLEYDFVVSPGADPSAIRLSVNGASKVTVDAEGNLVLGISQGHNEPSQDKEDGNVRILAPKAYQTVNGERCNVAGQWRLAANGTAEFALASYDHRQTLVIDPVLLYSSFLGGSENTSITRIAADSEGNAYVAGFTAAGDFPAAPTPQSSTFGGGTASRGAFVAKIDPTGSSLIYTTYLSGSVGEQASGLAVDASGNVYVTGTTHSLDFPVLGAFQSTCAVSTSGTCFDAFLTKIASSGNALVYSTYLGGTGVDSASGVAVDALGNAYVVGTTSSIDFPATAGAAQIACGGTCNQNAFVAKFGPTGATLAYATYLGGSGSDSAADIALDASGSAYVTGQTSSPDFPLASAFQKACTLDASSSTGSCVATSFVAKLKADGSGFAYSTYLGGSLGSKAAGIAVDALGSAYITGSTQSSDFPLRNALQKSCGVNAVSSQCAVNAFVTKLTPAGTALVYSTYLGGSTQDQGAAIAVDAAGNAHVVGSTASADFPTVKPVQPKLNGASDAFVAVLNPTGSALSFSTFHGGSATESGSSLALDSKANVYLAGQTSSTDFPTLTPFQSSCAGTCSNAFVSKISASPQVVAAPVIAKAFGAATIHVNGTTSLTFTLSNPDTVNAQTGLAFTDTLPASMVVASTPGLSNTCGGTATATAGATSVTLSGAGLAVSPATCTVSVNITDATAEADTNSVTVSSTNGGTGNTATANLTVVSPPVLSKTFGVASIPLNGSTSLSFTIQNNNATQSLAGVGFTDTLPTGVVISTPNGLTGTCGGGTITATAASGSASLSGATLAASASCTFSVNVTGTTAGAKNNVTTAVTSTEGGNGNTASASLTVVSPPSISKIFGAATIALSASTSLSFTIQNSNTTQSLSGVGVTDSLPAGLIVATPNGLSGSCGGGTITATAGSGSVSLSGATLASSASCTFAVNVTSTSAGAQNNTTSAVTSTEGGNGGTASASVNVIAPPSITKSFGVASVPLNGTTSLTFSITNPNAVALTGVAFTDSLPAGLVVATPNGLSNTCGGTAAATAGSATVSLTGSGVAASGSCTLSANVTGTTSGAKVNSVQVTSTNGGTGNTSNATLTVNAPGSITATAGSGQNAAAGTAFATALSATVKDTANNLVPGVTVTFTAPASGASGTFANGTITTTATTGTSGASLGIATASIFTAGCTLGGLGAFNVTATVSGVVTPATFGETITVGVSKTVTATAGTPQTEPVTDQYPTPFQATVTDCGGNPEPAGISVVFTAPSGGPSGKFTDTGNNSTTANTNSSGVATTALTMFFANTKSGSFTVSGMVGTATSASYLLTNTPGPPAAVAPTTGSTPQSVTVNTAFSNLGAFVTDSNGNPSGSGVPVVFTAPASGATGVFSNTANTITVNTNAGSIATAPFTANTTASPTAYSVTASTAGATTSANYVLTNVPGPPFTITVAAGTTPQNVAVTNVFGSALSGTVTDQYGNTVLAGVNVKLTAPSGAVASGTFSNSSNASTVATTASGTFSSSAFTANSVAGAYNVNAVSGAAGAQYALVNTNFSLSSTTPSIYIQGSSTPIATSAAPIITVTALPVIPPAPASYTGTVTLACVAASLPAGVTCPSFTPASAAFTDGAPASVLSTATVSIGAATPVGLYQTSPVIVAGADTSVKTVTNTTSFALAVECTYSFGNTASSGTLPTYSPLIPDTPYTFSVSEDAGGTACPWNGLTAGAGITGITTTSSTITTGAGTGTSVPFGVTTLAASAGAPQTDSVSISYFQVNGTSTTGTSTLSVVQEPAATLTGGVGTTDVLLTASSITAANPGTLAFPNAVGLATGVTTICGAQNSSGPDTSGNNYFITCSAQVTGNTATLAVTIGAATPASRPRENRAQLELLYSAGLGFPAIVFMGLGAAAFGPKRKRPTLRRIASLLGVLLVLSLLLLLPACSGGFSATFINPSQVGSYNITVMGYVTDSNNDVTAIEIFTVPMNVVK